MDSLQRCYEGQNYRSPMALLLLIWINCFFVRDSSAVEQLIEAVGREWPAAPLYHYLFGYFYRRRGQLDTGLERSVPRQRQHVLKH